jgi:hypothetical protein
MTPGNISRPEVLNITMMIHTYKTAAMQYISDDSYSNQSLDY